MAVDPIHFTNYDRTISELEEAVLFCLLVSGKNALTTANALDKLLSSSHLGMSEFKPFESLRAFSQKILEAMLCNSGIGCYTSKAKGIYQLVHSGLDLKTCTVDELISIHGVGLKTANFFLMHTRKGYRGCCLDRHILKHLGSLGHSVPKSTPQSKREYLRIESIFLGLADSMKVNPTDLDLQLWRQYAGHVV